MGNDAKEIVTNIANRLVEKALGDIAEKLDDDALQKDFFARLAEFSYEDISDVFDCHEYVNVARENVVLEVEEISKKYVEKVLSDIIKDLPNGSYKEGLSEDLSLLARQGIFGVLNGNSVEEVKNDLKQMASMIAVDRIKKGSTDLACQVVDAVADSLKEKGRGKSRTRRNRQIQSLSDDLKKQLEANIAQGVEALWRGDDFYIVGKQMVLDTSNGVLKNVVTKNSEHYIKMMGDGAAKKLKVSGKGSRTINRQIDNAKNVFVEEATNQVVQNAFEVLDGRKKISDAAKEVAEKTVKNGAKNYIKGFGAEVAAEGIKKLSRIAEKELKNEFAKNVASKGLGKLANANAVTQAAEALMEIGGSIKRVMKGEITKAEFLREIGEKGTAICVSSAYSAVGAMAGMAIGGPVGAMVGSAVGSMVGYIASSMFYGSVLKAFEDVEESRKRYEFIHEFCETSIRQMEMERQRFEKETAALFKHREILISDSFDKLDQATENGDFDSYTLALNQIAMEFGNGLKFSNMKEFDDFMSDDDTVFEL